MNHFKQIEERLLREIGQMQYAEAHEPFGAASMKMEGGKIPYAYDEADLLEAAKYLRIGFMLLNRAVFQPQRIKLPEDGE